MKISAIECPKCHDIIWSRAVHDFHYCSCRAVSIDGGFDYCHFGWQPEVDRPEIIQIDIEVTIEQCYNDWNKRINKLGTIKKFE